MQRTVVIPEWQRSVASRGFTVSLPGPSLCVALLLCLDASSPGAADGSLLEEVWSVVPPSPSEICAAPVPVVAPHSTLLQHHLQAIYDALKRTVAANPRIALGLLLEEDVQTGSGVVPRPPLVVPLRLSRPTNYWNLASSASSSCSDEGFGGTIDGPFGIPWKAALEKAICECVGIMDRASRAPEGLLDSLCGRLSVCMASASPIIREDLGGDPREIDFLAVLELEERIRTWTDFKLSSDASRVGVGANQVFFIGGVRCEFDLFSAQVLAAMRSIFEKFDVRMLVQFSDVMQSGEVAVSSGFREMLLARRLSVCGDRPPRVAGPGSSFRFGNGKVILLSEFALLSMQERHVAARRPVDGEAAH